MVSRHRRRLVAIASSAIIWGLISVLGWGLATLGAGSPPDTSVPDAEPATSQETASGPQQSLASSPTTSDPRRIRTCVLPESLFGALDGELQMAVGTGDSSDVLLGVDSDVAVAPASVLKLFTAVSAIRVLGPDFRFATSVVAGEGGELWLVGGGDVTLTRSPGGNYYGSLHSLDDLANQVAQSWERPPGAPVAVRADTTRYDGFPAWDDTWRSGSAALGYVAPVSPLQVDGDRDQPAVRLSPRSTDPTARATNWFAEALSRATGTNPTTGPPGLAPQAPVLATVSSAPLSELVGIMLIDSDNSLAEVIAREVALELGIDSVGQAVVAGLGVDNETFDAINLADGSGLSPLSAVTAESVVALLAEIDASSDLVTIRHGLPVAGETGSLRNRFGSVAGQLRGLVEAKTGSITGTRSLAGYLTADDGQQLLFSIVISGPRVSDATRDDIDRVLGGLAVCGENLADWAVPEPIETVG